MNQKNVKRRKSLCVFLTLILLMTTLLPSWAFGETTAEPTTATASDDIGLLQQDGQSSTTGLENDVNSISDEENYKFSITSNIERATDKTSTELPYIYENIKYNTTGDETSGIKSNQNHFVRIENYSSLTDYELEYIEINGVRITDIPEQSATGETDWYEFPEISGFTPSTTAISGMSYYDTGEFALRFYKNSTYESNINIHFQFKSTKCTPTVICADDSQGTATYEGTGNKNEYKLTATAKDGYRFDYWSMESRMVSGNAEYTVTLTEDTTFTAHFVDANAGYKFRVTSNIDRATDKTSTELPYIYENIKYNTTGDETSGIKSNQNHFVRIENYSSLTDYELEYIEINGVRITDIPEQSATGETDWYEFPEISGFTPSTTAISGMSYYDTGEFALRFYKNSTYESNINIHFQFQEKQGATYTATVTLAENNAEKGTIDKLEFVSNNENRTSSKWKLTTTPVDGYQLSYIQAGEDTSTRVDSEDGKTITWEISEDRDYTAYFEALTPKFGSHFWYGPATGMVTNYSSESKNTADCKTLFAGQSAKFQFEILITSEPPADSKVTYKIYSGEAASDDSLLGTYVFKFDGSGSRYPALLANDIPKTDKITVTAQLNDGEVISKTYDVKVEESGKTDLNFLSVPQDSGLYPYDGNTIIQGPNVYDACTFIDDETGALIMYIAASGGIMKYDGNGTAKLTYMEGMSFAYNTNERMSGQPLAIGGATEDALAAFVKEEADEYNESEYCIYICEDDTWKKVEGSGFEAGMSAYRTGLVLGKDDVWTINNQGTETKHWNGSSWETYSTAFNSFWKKDSSTVYAGSADGIYKYDGAAWTKVDGTSGKMYISNGCSGADGDTLITSTTWTAPDSTTGYANMGGTISKITISSDSIVSNPVDVSALPGTKIYVGVNSSGELYAIVAGSVYTMSQSAFGGTEYQGAMVYKLVNGAWQYRIVKEFNDENDAALLEEGKMLGITYMDDDLSVSDEEKSNYIGKNRADGVMQIMNLLEKISLFIGKAGAIYTQFGDATITFDAQGGSDVASITKTIGAKVTAPESPTYDGKIFVGWYTDADCTEGNLYTFNVMPAKDITLYAKWGADLTDSRAAALAALEKQYTAYQQEKDEYTDEGWKTITTAYESGKSGIETADTYDGIEAAKNDAIDAMAKVPLNPYITVTVSVEKFSVDGTYIIEPTAVTVPRYTQVSVVITDLLKEYYKGVGTIANGYNGNPYRLGDGATETGNFYLAGVYDPSYDPTKLGSGFSQGFTGFLSEFDGGSQSGWMYCVNGNFPEVGASAYTLNSNGDVLRWQYTCEGLGADIGADNDEWGSGDSVVVADKDALTARIAEINKDKQAFFDETPDGSNEKAYNEALAVLADIDATQEEVDAALEAIGGSPLSDEEKLAKAKETAINELNSYDLADYREEEQKKLTEYRNAALAAIEAATTVDEVKTVLSDAKTKIAALLTAAEYEAIENAADADTTEIYEKTGAYLNDLGTPGVGSTGGEWIVIGLARAEYQVSTEWSAGYYNNAVAYVKENIDKTTGRLHDVKSTDNSRLILALTATGRDVTNVDGYNLLTALADLDYLKKQGNNGPIWALIALDSYGYEIPNVTTGGTQATRENIIDTILAAQLSDGGWTLDTGTTSDVDMTAMALQALAPYYKDESHAKHAEVKAAVDKALALLSKEQNSTGGYSSWGTGNSESCAQVVTALTALGINPDRDENFIKNGYSVLDALMVFYVEGQGFQHTIGGGSDGMATEQAYYAMASYYRLLDGKTSLYDMSDVKIMSSEERIAEVQDLIDNLPDNITLDDKDAVNTALSAYNNLSAAEKAKVGTSRVKKLNDAVKTISDLEVKNVEDLIAAIGKVTLDKEDEIAKANAAYNALSKEQQKQVSNYDVLKAAIEKLAALKSGSTGTTTKTASGTTRSVTKSANVKLTGDLTEAAQNVIDMIDAIVESKLSDDAAEYTEEQMDAILEAYRAYNDLTAEEQLAVEKSDNFEAYSDICLKLGECYHYDEPTGTDMRDNTNDVLPWYIKLVVKPQVVEDQQQEDLKGTLGDESELFTLSDIYFINMLDGSTWHPESALKVKIPMVDIGSYKSAVIVHFTDDGKIELIEGKVVGDEIEFYASDFSLYGIAGSMQSLDDLLAAQDAALIWPWLLLAALALIAIIILVYRKKRKKEEAVTDISDLEL